MEVQHPKPYKPGAAAAKKGLELADKQIAWLRDRKLPENPHLLRVETTHPFRNVSRHEYEGTPFEPHEVKYLQYMTMISTSYRGIASTHGNWQDKIDGMSPSSIPRSNSSTPAPTQPPKVASKKISIADYKNMKNGVKPSPKATASDLPTPSPGKGILDEKLGAGGFATPEMRQIRDRDAPNEAVSAAATPVPMSRGPSYEGLALPHPRTSPSDNKFASANLSIGGKAAERKEIKGKEKSGIQPQPSTSVGANARAATNGTTLHPSSALQAKVSNKDFQSQKSNLLQPKEPLTHKLPPRPQSPARKPLDSKHHTPESKPQKRSNESADASYPEKRAKVEHQRSPSIPKNSLPRKPVGPFDGKRSPTKLHKPQSSPQPKKETSTKTIKTDVPKSSEEPLDLPRLLSPLPADLDHGLAAKPSRANGVRSEKLKASTPNTPSKHPHDSDTIVVKEATTVRRRQEKPGISESSPLSTPPESSGSGSDSPPFVLPPLLDPTLPGIIEQELERLKEKASEKSTTIEDYENHKTQHKAAEGARAATQALLQTQQKLADKSALNSVEARHEKARRPDTPGVARKTPHAKVGHPPKEHKDKESPSSKRRERESLIIKLKYKKRQSIPIQRILGVRPRPEKEFLRLEAERKDRLKQPLSAKGDVSSEEDVPLAAIQRSATSNTSTVSKKRSSDHFEPASEPAPKRTKAENLDISKSKGPVQSPFKSPALTAPSQKSLLATPKKEAMKSTAMRKVDSSEGHARTPQTGRTSTPASTEKPRINGELRPHNIESEKYLETALRLKRKMDEILQNRSGDLSPEQAKKEGLATGLKSVLNYMCGWSAAERGTRRRHASWEGGLGLLEFVTTSSRNIPVLSNLSSQVGALLREELGRAYVEQLAIGGGKDGLSESLVKNAKARDGLYERAYKTRNVVVELGVHDVIGPWCSTQDALVFVEDVVKRFLIK